MPHLISRRRVLAAGAASAGMMLGGSLSSGHTSAGPGREAFWGPGPNKNLVRDLAAGNTTIRLSGYLPRPEGESPGETVRKIREQGLTAVIASADDWHGAKDSAVRELKAALREHDVVVFEVGGYRNIICTDEKLRRKFQKRIAMCLEAAEKIGCPMVGCITGSRNPEANDQLDNYAVHPDNWTLETWKLTIESIRTILRDTAGLKAAIGMEAQVTTNLDSPLAHRRLMDDVGSDRCRVNLDPTNMMHLHNHFHTTELINECFDLLGEDILGCHAKDSYILPHSQTVHVQEVCPGRGNLDYATYLVRLSKMKWPRSLLPEHIPQEQHAEAYAYIRSVAAKVGVKIHGSKV